VVSKCIPDTKWCAEILGCKSGCSAIVALFATINKIASSGIYSEKHTLSNVHIISRL
jgi:hypothetical protein